MTLRTFLLGSFVGTILGWLVWLAIVFWLDPIQAGTFGFVLFFLALFLAIASTTALIGYALRRILAPGHHPAYSVRPSLRQGIWLGLLFDLLVLLQLLRLGRWWLTLIIVIFFISLEFVFLSYDRNVKTNRTAQAGIS